MNNSLAAGVDSNYTSSPNATLFNAKGADCFREICVKFEKFFSLFAVASDQNAGREEYLIARVILISNEFDARYVLCDRRSFEFDVQFSFFELETAHGSGIISDNN